MLRPAGRTGRRRGCRRVRCASCTWAGTRRIASRSATTASGSVRRKTEPHQLFSRSNPDRSGPSEEIAPPIPDQSAIDFVRAGPRQSAVMSASVVGNAMPAARPPPTRARNRTSSFGAHAARRLNGIASVVPTTSIILRPYRSPSAPKYRTDAASPSEYPTAIRFRLVWDASKAAPIDGSATLATARLRFATAATRISAMRTRPPRSGALTSVACSSAIVRPSPSLAAPTIAPGSYVRRSGRRRHCATSAHHRFEALRRLRARRRPPRA